MLLLLLTLMLLCCCCCCWRSCCVVLLTLMLCSVVDAHVVLLLLTLMSLLSLCLSGEPSPTRRRPPCDLPAGLDPVAGDHHRQQVPGEVPLHHAPRWAPFKIKVSCVETQLAAIGLEPRLCVLLCLTGREEVWTTTLSHHQEHFVIVILFYYEQRAFLFRLIEYASIYTIYNYL